MAERSHAASSFGAKGAAPPDRARHAVHHLEKALDKAAVQYVLGRFACSDNSKFLENQYMHQVNEDALRKRHL